MNHSLEEESTTTSSSSVQVVVRLKPLLEQQLEQQSQNDGLPSTPTKTNCSNRINNSIEILPPEEDDKDDEIALSSMSGLKHDDDTELQASARTPAADDRKSNSNTHKTYKSLRLYGHQTTYTFDEVFPSDVTQGGVYARRVLPLVESCLEGYNSTILAYGQTGSGKTHTIMGPPSASSAACSRSRNGAGDNDDDAINMVGMIPRAVMSIFHKLKEMLQDNDCLLKDYKISIQFLEIYGEEIRDLLSSSSSSTPSSGASPSTNSTKIIIRDVGVEEAEVVGAKRINVKSAEETLLCITQGMLKRATASTGMNEASSRSHAILSLLVQQTIASPSDSITREHTRIKKSRFNFVDLAGSERYKRIKPSEHINGQKRIKEMIDINQGLLVLGNVISALSSSTSSVTGAGGSNSDNASTSTYVPYRHSKLTRLLKGSLGGNHKTLMIVCVSQSLHDVEETINCLRYASRAKKIQNHATINIHDEKPSGQLLSKLQRQIQMLANDLLHAKQGDTSACSLSEEFVEFLANKGKMEKKNQRHTRSNRRRRRHNHHQHHFTNHHHSTIDETETTAFDETEATADSDAIMFPFSDITTTTDGTTASSSHITRPITGEIDHDAEGDYEKKIEQLQEELRCAKEQLNLQQSMMQPPAVSDDCNLLGHRRHHDHNNNIMNCNYNNNSGVQFPMISDAATTLSTSTNSNYVSDISSCDCFPEDSSSVTDFGAECGPNSHPTFHRSLSAMSCSVSSLSISGRPYDVAQAQYLSKQQLYPDPQVGGLFVSNLDQIDAEITRSKAHDDNDQDNAQLRKDLNLFNESRQQVENSLLAEKEQLLKKLQASEEKFNSMEMYYKHQLGRCKTSNENQKGEIAKLKKELYYMEYITSQHIDDLESRMKDKNQQIYDLDNRLREQIQNDLIDHDNMQNELNTLSQFLRTKISELIDCKQKHANAAKQLDETTTKYERRISQHKRKIKQLTQKLSNKETQEIDLKQKLCLALANLKPRTPSSPAQKVKSSTQLSIKSSPSKLITKASNTCHANGDIDSASVISDFTHTHYTIATTSTGNISASNTSFTADSQNDSNSNDHNDICSSLFLDTDSDSDSDYSNYDAPYKPAVVPDEGVQDIAEIDSESDDDGAEASVISSSYSHAPVPKSSLLASPPSLCLLQSTTHPTLMLRNPGLCHQAVPVCVPSAPYTNITDSS